MLFTNLKTQHLNIIKWLLLLVWPFLGFLLLPFSKNQFDAPFSTVIYSVEGRLLGAGVAEDNQWRFPFNLRDSLPEKFETCLLEFEDKAFYSHPGINPFSIARAIQQNWEAQKVVSGGSTITMQLARMFYQNQARNIPQKIKEIFLALRLEVWFSKSEILALYAQLAPYGGNVVGLETAAWRYYNRPAKYLSWGESALLAVLPNAPSLLYPGKNAELLEQKRNRLLDQLLKHGKMDTISNFLAKKEVLPLQPKPLPLESQHLLQFLVKEKGAGQNFRTSISSGTQEKVQKIAQSYQRGLAGNGVHNLAILVINNRSQKVVAYQGNLAQNGQHSDKVDCIQAPRSTGSLLKPFLFASLLQNGARSSGSLIPDVPINISGFKPQNFTHHYSGAIPFQKALSKSLNIPFVIALRNFGIFPFLENLKALGLKSINKSAGYYGLSLILGGGESSLWELSQAFSYLGQTLNGNGLQALSVIPGSDKGAINALPFSKGVIYQTLEAMTDVQRPGVQGNWKAFLSSQKIAWKTGTSYGHRDAWAIGLNKDYTIGVWVGNASGEGREGLTGNAIAGPILFEVFGALKSNEWFTKPNTMESFAFCAKSGYKAAAHCPRKINEFAPAETESSPLCPFHPLIFLDNTGEFQVNQICGLELGINTRPWFLLPPTQGKFYGQENPDYLPLPPFHPRCKSGNENPIQIIYPGPKAQIFIPRSLNGEASKVILEAAHQNMDSPLFWYLNEEYLGQTFENHSLEVYKGPGKYQLMILDSKGNKRIQNFEIVEP